MDTCQAPGQLHDALPGGDVASAGARGGDIHGGESSEGARGVRGEAEPPPLAPPPAPPPEEPPDGLLAAGMAVLTLRERRSRGARRRAAAQAAGRNVIGTIGQGAVVSESSLAPVALRPEHGLSHGARRRAAAQTAVREARWAEADSFAARAGAGAVASVEAGTVLQRGSIHLLSRSPDDPIRDPAEAEASAADTASGVAVACGEGDAGARRVHALRRAAEGARAGGGLSHGARRRAAARTAVREARRAEADSFAACAGAGAVASVEAGTVLQRGSIHLLSRSPDDPIRDPAEAEASAADTASGVAVACGEGNAGARRVHALRCAAEGARAGGGEPLDAARAGAAEEKGDGGDYGEVYYRGWEGDVDADAEMAACVEDGCWDSD